MNSKELRKKFLEYFKEKGHLVLPSASLVPAEVDPTVLFTTAGMQQFKRYYLEPSEAPDSRLATCQKCVRTGDIDEVGDATHCTFFEMLGNFSFGFPEKKGSYSKKEAIFFAWEFLTQVLKINENRIYATYFQGERGVAEDRESLEILQGIDSLVKVVPQGFNDNFWSLGTENSPGGPTVEFYVDGVEVWNLVFNEYVLRNGIYESAKLKGIDTGMGFERLAVMLQGSASVYETDLFALAKKRLSEIKTRDDATSERIILDHVRSAIFMINDGVLPSNKDRGYVLRRIIRRAIVKAQQIGISNNFTANLAKEFYPIYEGIYEFSKETIEQELEKEESKFQKTLKDGLKILESKNEVSGRDLFDLYQSFGIPSEISLEEINRLKTHLLPNAVGEYEELFRKHQELSRTASAGMFKGGLSEAGEMTAKYHTATHLLLAALREVLGKDVFQRGSNITAERLRFDFSYPEKLTQKQISEVEDIVNKKIEEDLPVDMMEMSLIDAKECGAMGIFESKYGEKVKVYTIGRKDSSTPNGRMEPPFSREICGGPHASHTGELGHFKIKKEESSSAGIRRIKAVLE